MRTVTISRLKNELSAFLELAKRGETIVVLDRTVPVARIVSAVSSEGKVADEDEIRLRRLEAAGVIRRGAPAKIREALKRGPVKLKSGGDVMRALLAEREEARF
jgi:prevent-host-death family protein